MGVPGIALDAISCTGLQVIEGHRCVGGVELDPSIRPFHDDTQRIQHRVLHPVPGQEDGAIAERGGVELGGSHHCRQQEDIHVWLIGAPNLPVCQI